MWTLPIPDDSERLAELLMSLEYKNGNPKYDISKREIVIIEAIYDLYHEVKALHHDSFLSDLLSDEANNAVANAYSEVQVTGRLKTLRSKLLLSASRCPICGFEPVSDLDHYLPESVYKALAIYSRNLIPLCHKCNNKKRAAVVEGGIGFLHCYYSAIPSVKFLSATCIINDNLLNFEFNITKTDDMSEEVYNSMLYQVDRVDLFVRLIPEVNIMLGSMYTGMLMAYEQNGGEGLKSLLNLTVADYVRRYGINDWRTAVIDSLFENDDFCNGAFIQLLGH